jgi:hypothetical protein
VGADHTRCSERAPSPTTREQDNLQGGRTGSLPSSIAASHCGLGLDHSNEPSSSVEAAFSRQVAAEPGQLLQVHPISVPDACQTACSYRANTSVRS